jgi:glycerol-3-phosphate acyltransferase PlsY
MTTWLVFIIAAYLAGSIPFGLIIGRCKGIDIREQGSKNIGATNVGRVLGRRCGGICFALDVLKGALPVLAAGIYHQLIGRGIAELTQMEMWLWLAVAVAAVAGHMASIFIGFKGGKGVATAFGTMAAMWPLLTIPALAALVVWYTTLRVSKYVSVASILAALSLPVCAALSAVPRDMTNIGQALAHAQPILIITITLALVVVYRHRTNIARLRRGEEPKTRIRS